MYSIYEKLLKERNISNYRVAKDTGITQTTLSDWKKGKITPKTDTLNKIADYFGVSLDFLIGNSEIKTNEEINKCDFTVKDKRDIAKTMNFMLEQLDNCQEALMFDGEPLDDESRELLKVSLENSVKTAKLLAKQKFTPNKYKK